VFNRPVISVGAVGERVKRAVICLLAASALLAFETQFASAAPADLDRSFGGDGVVAVEPPAASAFSTYAAGRMALGLDDEIFVLYSLVGACPSIDSCQVDWSLARYDRDGNRDAQFGTGAGSSLSFKGIPYRQADVAVGPDGKPVVAAIGSEGLVVARFDRAGHLDGGFGKEGKAANTPGVAAGTPPAIAVQADGKALVAVEGSAGEVSSGLLLFRYMPDGTLDPSFGQGGMTAVKLETQSRPAGLLLGAGGAVSVGVSECCKGEGGMGAGVSFGRFLTSGGFDPSFAGDGSLFFPMSPPGFLRAIAASIGASAAKGRSPRRSEPM
jgi:uncharacterized delta-60 repeat protein